MINFISLATNFAALIIMPICFYFMLKQVKDVVDELWLDNKRLNRKIIDIKTTLDFNSSVEKHQAKYNWEQRLEEKIMLEEKIKQSHKDCVKKECTHQCNKHCEDK